MNDTSRSIVNNNTQVNPAVREAILSGHDKFGAAFEALAEGAGKKDDNGSFGTDEEDFLTRLTDEQKAEVEYVASVAKRYPEASYVALSPLSFENGRLPDHYAPIVGYEGKPSVELMEELEDTLPKGRIVNWNPEPARSDYLVIWSR